VCEVNDVRILKIKPFELLLLYQLGDFNIVLFDFFVCFLGVGDELGINSRTMQMSL
jgi:hypothetical protein